MGIPQPTHQELRGDGRFGQCFFAKLAYESFLKPRPDVASSQYDNLQRAFIDKTFECSVLANAKANAELPPHGKHRIGMHPTVLPPIVLAQPLGPGPNPSHPIPIPTVTIHVHVPVKQAQRGIEESRRFV
jgi:hypothetical protein